MKLIDEHDRRLAALVHPPDWRNPEPRPLYDLVVLGAGTAGLVTAAGAAGLGARVALVEKDLMGGDCLNVGCVPSKALLRAAHAARDARGDQALGVEVPGGAHVDFARVMERLRRVRADLAPTDSAERFRGLGVDVFLGEGRFSAKNAVLVDGRSLRFVRAVVATGARAAAPPIPGLSEVGYLTNETVFSLTVLPARLIVIGGGPIGCELAQAFARLGAGVTLVQTEPRILAREDPEAAAIVGAALRRDGVTVLCGRKAERAEPAGEGEKRLVLGGGETLDAEEILVGVGRAPNVEGIGLETAGVAFDRSRGVTTDDQLRTTNPKIYACGDVCAALKFTHHADFQARTVIQNALFFGRAKASALVVPRVTYTDPEVAHVGLTADEARERGIEITTLTQKLEDIDRARLDGETEGFARVHVARGKDTILGATVVARHAGEMISEITTAMVSGTGLGKVARVIHPYPTQADAIRKLGDQYNKTRLTPLAKRVLEGVIALRRWI